MKLKNIAINLFFISLILLPLFLWLSWFIMPKKPMRILIVDKTVKAENYNEHESFNWVLNHEKYIKPNGKFYQTKTDYFGYFPSKNGEFEIHDLSGAHSSKADSFANQYDMVYFTDTYGIYKQTESVNKPSVCGHVKVYGGLDNGDFQLIKKMKEQKKLILAEFNILASPTEKELQLKTQNLLGIIWSGWTLRYFESLDTLKNSDLPKWVVTLYKQQHNNSWPFKNSGVVFVNEDETIAILENKTNLKHATPLIITHGYGQEKFDLPYMINYLYWSDITYPTDTTHRIVSYFKLNTNASGDSILKHQGIPHVYPAVIESNDSRFYYFCGDFSDNPINTSFSKINGTVFLKNLFLNKNSNTNRTVFFWNFYYPLVKNIMQNYYAIKQ